MARKNIPDARNRILQAAIRVFSLKSYEGSRVDEISAEANVPKSLIYYHFKSKEEIFDVLLNDFINEYILIIKSSTAQGHQNNREDAGSMSYKLKYDYKEFAYENSDLLRIILIDSLKKSNKRPAIYRIVDALVDAEEKVSVTTDSNRSERLIAEFFTNILPNSAVFCFMDTFTDYFHIDKSQFGKLFVQIMEATHGAYHKSLLLSEKS
jgi:AcrR family transcriptional regulator